MTSATSRIKYVEVPSSTCPANDRGNKDPIFPESTSSALPLQDETHVLKLQESLLYRLFSDSALTDVQIKL